MVILQFNKLIRNKWVWGVFAIAISAAFCFDDLFSGRDPGEARAGNVGTLAGKPVKASEFHAVAEDVRGIGRGRDWSRKQNEVNREAWEILAAVDTARANGMEATGNAVREAIRRDRSFAPQGGAFSFQLYQRILAENGMSPERFEAYVQRRLTAGRAAETAAEAAAWVSPAEQKQAVADMTDVLTVKVARFVQTKAEADKVTLDEKGLKKWYDENTNSIALPERMRLRMIRFDATDEKVLAKMSVSDAELRDYYDANTEKYTTTGTNGVEVTKKFEEVKGEIEKVCRRIAAVQYFETNLNRRVYAVKAAKGASRLDEIAKEDGLKVTTSDWFSTQGGYVDGFMTYASMIAPGANGFAEAVAELDPSSDDLRYAVLSSDKAVWIVERAEVSKAHVPTFAEAKEIVRPRALKDAQAEAFKAAVEAIAAKGTNAVCAAKDVSTNLTFSVSTMSYGAFPDQSAVVGAARKLAKGGISPFVPTGTDRGLLVVCVDRKAGDAANAAMFAEQARETLSMMSRRQLPEKWMKQNLAEVGFEPGDEASVTASESEE